MKKSRAVWPCAVLMLVGVPAWAGEEAAPDRDTVYQVSTIPALKAGDYEGCVSYGDLGSHGDFGIGTFDGLDGEMIEVGSEFYRVAYDGSVTRPEDSTLAPYATVTFFEADQTILLEETVDYEAARQQMEARIERKDIPHAIRIEGRFDYVKARSVPAQTKPYPPLEEVLKQQSIFEFTNTSGVAVGFWFPASMDAVQQPGFHLHFITADRSAGGHLLDFKAQRPRVEVDHTPGFELTK